MLDDGTIWQDATLLRNTGKQPSSSALVGRAEIESKLVSFGAHDVSQTHWRLRGLWITSMTIICPRPQAGQSVSEDPVSLVRPPPGKGTARQPEASLAWEAATPLVKRRQRMLKPCVSLEIMYPLRPSVWVGRGRCRQDR
jgi:hypothetical protein